MSAMEEQLFFGGWDQYDNAPGEIQGSREQQQSICEAAEVTHALRTLREAELDHLRHEPNLFCNYLTFLLLLEQYENYL